MARITLVSKGIGLATIPVNKIPEVGETINHNGQWTVTKVETATSRYTDAWVSVTR